MENENKLSFMEQVRTIAYYIVCTKSIKTSTIQRKYGYHFNTSSEIIYTLEKLGIVSNFNEIKYERTILVEGIEELEEKLDFYF